VKRIRTVLKAPITAAWRTRRVVANLQVIGSSGE
jgi:hypothetical protein